MRGIFTISLFIFCFVAGVVFGGTLDAYEGEAIMPGVDGQEVVLFVLPSGTGSSFYEAQVRDNGAVIDAHIEFTVRDQYGNPVPNIPFEDLWLFSEDSGMVPCTGGTCADSDTDSNGFTTWESPLHAGGHSGALLHVGTSIPMMLTNASFPMSIVSADMNADGAVNMVDVGLFATAYFGGYDSAADFFADGVLSLSDVGRFAHGLGGSCP